MEELRREAVQTASTLKAIMADMDTMTTTLETKKVVAELKYRLDEFTAIEHIHAIKTIFLPKVKRFSDLIDYW